MRFAQSELHKELCVISFSYIYINQCINANYMIALCIAFDNIVRNHKLSLAVFLN
jgi:hypothetical protein